jgi:hypothetical protein
MRSIAFRFEKADVEAALLENRDRYERMLAVGAGHDLNS